MKDRIAIGYIVQVDGATVLMNLHDSHRGQVAAYREGLAFVGQPGDLLVALGGTDLIVLRVMSIEFAEPREAHATGVGTSLTTQEPLRQVRARATGYLRRESGNLTFTAESWRLPALGAEVVPLSSEETAACVSAIPEGKPIVTLGREARSDQVQVRVEANTFLARHVAVLGSTGQGKTHFIAAIIQQLLEEFDQPRVVIFDVNNEYRPAFEHLGPPQLKKTVLGRSPPEGHSADADVAYSRIPYYALGRHGLGRLLLPSEKTQLPALRFAIENLKFVEADPAGARPAGDSENVLFDDCRNEDADEALTALRRIRRGEASTAGRWPHMCALSCLSAEWGSLQTNRNGQPERNGFHYGNIAPLVNRIRGLVEDERFRDIVQVEGGSPVGQSLEMQSESRYLVESIFGPEAEDDTWNVHVVDLSRLTQDLMPFVLGSLLELYAAVLFRRGPGRSRATLLVLEEAHHYLRQLPGDPPLGHQAIAYERLAKEGRKFSLALLLSTQRPSELSPTVLAQCATWCVFGLTNESDQKAVRAASEWGGSYVAQQISGLPRGDAVVFGAAVPMPTRISVVRAKHEPESSDADLTQHWGP